jgi:hypothetical protein
LWISLDDDSSVILFDIALMFLATNEHEFTPLGIRYWVLGVSFLPNTQHLKPNT